MGDTANHIQKLEKGNCLAGDTLVIDRDGELYTLEDLAVEDGRVIEVQAIDQHGRLIHAKAHSFRIGTWHNKLYQIRMSNGHVIEATADHPFLTSNGEWITAENLVFGHLLKSAMYDPKQKNPILTINEVSSVRVKELDEMIPMYDFTVESEENLFVAQEIDGKYSLLCVHNSAAPILEKKYTVS